MTRGNKAFLMVMCIYCINVFGAPYYVPILAGCMYLFGFAEGRTSHD